MMSKTQLLETLKTRRSAWDALLASIGEERMTQPGAAGHWSVKDIVCHVTAYERWLVEWLTAASQNTFPAPSPLDDADVERRNARVHEMTRSTPLDDVLNGARRNFEALLEIIKALPDGYFDDPQSAEWFMKPYWSKMETVPDTVINLSADHYEEHIPGLKAWIGKNETVLRRDIRYQAGILQNDKVLLVKMRTPDGRTFWLPPGGGREGNETPEECILREIREETGLTVRVDRLLFIEPDMPGGVYDFLHTYLCRPVSGIAQPGVEPEAEFMPVPVIEDLGWFDLRDPGSWRPKEEMGIITFAWLEKLRAAVGYGSQTNKTKEIQK